MRRSTLHRLKDGIRGESVAHLKNNMQTSIGSNYMFEKSAPEDARALTAFFDRADALLKERIEKYDPNSESDKYVPPLKRQWVQAPPSVLSTSVSRRDWFRLMTFNWMADSFTTYTDQAALKAVPSNDAPSPLSHITATAPSADAGAPGQQQKQAGGGGQSGTATGPPVADIKDARTTTPVTELEVRIPSFARPGASSSSAFVTYDPKMDTSLPPFLDPNYRRSYLVNEVRHYDPDLLCLNEVNRSHFNESIWKYLRALGYGVLYTSSRGYKVKALRRGDISSAAKHAGKVTEQEDIGNVLCFHKARFVPSLMPGPELPNHLHFAQFCSMKDKVTGMQVLVANVQLTAGYTKEAQEMRENEARMVLKILQSISYNDVDRAHTTVIVCGDLNCTDEEEPCVQAIRERLFSAYDLVGGPRWTTWCKSKDGGMSNAYFETNRGFHVQSNQTVANESKMKVAIQRRVEDRETMRSVLAAEAASKRSAAVAAATKGASSKPTNADQASRSTTATAATTVQTTAAAVPPANSSSQRRKHKIEKRFLNPKFPWLSEVRVVEVNEEGVEVVPSSGAVSAAAAAPSSPDAAPTTSPSTADGAEEAAAPPSSGTDESASAPAATQDTIAEERRVMLHQGIIKRTQDFIFYDPNTLALHKVLDAPEESEIDDIQMLPSTKHPSHHIPLIVDVSFNDVHPDVAKITLKP